MATTIVPKDKKTKRQKETALATAHLNVHVPQELKVRMDTAIARVPRLKIKAFVIAAINKELVALEKRLDRESAA